MLTVLGPGHIDLDLLAQDGGAVHPLGRLRGGLLAVVGHEGVAAENRRHLVEGESKEDRDGGIIPLTNSPLASVVRVRDGSELFELRLYF